MKRLAIPSLLAVTATITLTARQQPTFPIEETTIAQIHAAIKAKRLTCRALVDTTGEVWLKPDTTAEARAEARHDGCLR